MAKRKRGNADHVRRRNVPGPDNEVIEARLQELISPAVANQLAYYRQLGLRSRILNLPLMVAAVLTILWRQVPSVHELTRLLAREDLLWCQAVKVSQQALSQRFLGFPAELFERVLKELLPKLEARWHQRQVRPLPESLAYAQQHFEQIWVADGSTLEALFRKLKVLEDVPVGRLAGKMGTVVDLMIRLPVEIGSGSGLNLMIRPSYRICCLCVPLMPISGIRMIRWRARPPNFLPGQPLASGCGHRVYCRYYGCGP